MNAYVAHVSACFFLSMFNYFIDWMELFCTILYVLYLYWLMLFSVRGLRKMLVSIFIWRWWECTSVTTQVDICIYIYIQTQEQPCLPSTFLSTSMLIRIESQKRSNSRTWTFDEICIWSWNPGRVAEYWNHHPTVQHEAQPPTKSRRMDNHADGLMIKLNLHQLVLRRSEYNRDIVTWCNISSGSRWWWWSWKTLGPYGSQHKNCIRQHRTKGCPQPRFGCLGWTMRKTSVGKHGMVFRIIIDEIRMKTWSVGGGSWGCMKM